MYQGNGAMWAADPHYADEGTHAAGHQDSAEPTQPMTPPHQCGAKNERM